MDLYCFKLNPYVHLNVVSVSSAIAIGKDIKLVATKLAKLQAKYESSTLHKTSQYLVKICGENESSNTMGVSI